MSRPDRLCASCGQPFVSPIVGKEGTAASGAASAGCGNAWCTRAPRSLTTVYAVGPYRGRLRRAIVSYKYRRDLRWARPFAVLLHRYLVSHDAWFEEFGVLCPVPGPSGAPAGAGWGHNELVCFELATMTGISWPVEHLVSKTSAAGPMCNRPRAQRLYLGRSQLPGAWRVPRPADVAGRRVVLVDDVCTSGETLCAVAGVLARAGAAEVVGLVLARSCWRGAAGG